MKRVVITGMGIYSCIGRNQEEVKESLFQGKSGIGIAPARKEMGYFSALTGLVERPDLKKLLDRKKRHSLAEQGEYAIWLPWKHSGKPDRRKVPVGERSRNTVWQ